MDILQEYALPLLSTYETLEPYTRAPLSLLRALSTKLSPLVSQAYPLIRPYIDSALRTLHDSPAILSLAAILLLLILALQILSFVRRVMIFWMRVVFRLAFLAAVGVLVAVVWQRGLGRTLEDLGRWAEEVRRFWEGEYTRLEGHKNAGNGGSGGRGGGGSWAGGGGKRYGAGNGRANAGSTWR